MRAQPNAEERRGERKDDEGDGGCERGRKTDREDVCGVGQGWPVIEIRQCHLRVSVHVSRVSQTVSRVSRPELE